MQNPNTHTLKCTKGALCTDDGRFLCGCACVIAITKVFKGVKVSGMAYFFIFLTRFSKIQLNYGIRGLVFPAEREREKEAERDIEVLWDRQGGILKGIRD